MLRACLLAVMVLASCAPAGAPVTRAAPDGAVALPAMKRFDRPPQAAMPAIDNAQLARDFLELTFQMESGRAVPVFSRFEGPITVGVAGTVPTSLGPDLRDLVARLRNEAGIDIRLADAGRAPSITIEAVPQAELQRIVPQAACFVVPRVVGWADYLSKRRGPTTDWTTLTTRTRASVFLPSDVSPQEIRDCLHEEIAQALGPLNDLYRLPHSVFNDDNIHAVLTAYDMAILRTTYDSALKSGMAPQAVADALPAILGRVNPAGQRKSLPPVIPSSTEWKAAIGQAVAPRMGNLRRISAARRAVDIAQAQGWTDARLGFSLLSYGRAALARDPEVSIAAFVEAARAYKASYGADVHAAHVAVQLAAFSLSAGQGDVTLRITNDALPAAMLSQNASLLSTLLLLKAEALETQGRVSEASATRTEGLGWGRYAFGDDTTVTARATEVAALRPGV